MKQFSYEFPTEVQQLLIRCFTHLGGSRKSSRFGYAFKVQGDDKTTVIDIAQQYQKLVLAARAVCAYKPSRVYVCASRTYAFKACQRFCDMTGCTPLIGRFVPGTFTDPCRLVQPFLIIVADPYSDSQAVKEAAYVNVPCIALCNTENDLRFVDIVVPCNNRSLKAIGAMFCVFAKLVMQMKGHGRMVDNLADDLERFFYRDPVELEKLAAEQEEEIQAECAERPEEEEIKVD